VGIHLYNNLHISETAENSIEQERKINFFHSNCGWTRCKTHLSKNKNLNLPYTSEVTTTMARPPTVTKSVPAIKF